MKKFLSLFAFALLSTTSFSQTITTFAGTSAGYSGDEGLATAAQLNQPSSMAFDAAGNVYIDDSYNNVIRKVDINTGIITTIAGNGTQGYSGDNGPATSAQMNAPQSIAIDIHDNLYIGDWANNVIRKVVLSTGIITTIAGTGVAGYSGDNGLATSAQLNLCSSIGFDPAGNVYITDFGNNVIRKVDIAGIITTYAGTGSCGYSGDNGPAIAAQICAPLGMQSDASGNLFISDIGNTVVRKIDISTGIITTVAGNGTTGYSGDNGPATSAQLNANFDVSVDGAGNLYIADFNNNVIRKVNTSGIISTYAGNGTGGYSGDNGPATSAQLNNPMGVKADASGNIYIGDWSNNVVRKVSCVSNPNPFANTCATSFSLGTGDTTYAITPSINSTVTWFDWQNTDNMVSFAFLFDSDNTSRIKKIEIYEGSCSSLNLLASDSGGTFSDTAFYFNFPKMTPGSNFFFKIYANINTCTGTPISGKIITHNYTSSITCVGSGVPVFPCDIACNGSMESGSCPNFSSSNLASCWNPNPVGAFVNTPDYYANNCTPITTPHGNVCPFTGDRMQGEYVFSPGASNTHREYMYNKLSTPMVAAKNYYVKFFTAAANYAYQIDAIGAYITSSPPAMTSPGVIIVAPQISNATGSIIVANCSTTTPAAWTIIHGCYTATGGEQYVTLGNFVANSSVTSSLITPASCQVPSGSAYYLFDQLSVEAIDADAGPDQTIACGGTVTIGTGTCTTSDITYSWAPSTGLSSTTTLTTTAHPTVTTTYTLTVHVPSSSGPGCSFTSTVTVFVNTPTVTATANSSIICSGATATLTASGASTYTWFPGGVTGSTQIVTPTTTSNYTVIGTAGTCTASAVVTVTVNPTPTVTVNSATICAGSSTVINASGASTYTWSPATGLSSTSGSSVTANPTITINYTVQGTSAAGCLSAPATFTVKVRPLPGLNATASNTFICSATPTATTVLNAGASSPFFAFNWSVLPNTSFSPSNTVANPTVTITAYGTYVFTVTATNTITNCSNTSTVSVIVNPIPTVTVNSPSICKGATTTLTASGATSYTWMPGNTNGNTHVVSPANTHTYTVTGDLNGCTNSATATVTVNPLPGTFTWTPIPCSGTTNTVSITPTQTNVTYAWTPSVVCQNLSCSQVVLTPTAGVHYTVVATDANGCSRTVNLSPLTSPGLTLTPTQNFCGAGTFTTTINATTNPSNSSVTWTAPGGSTFTCNPGPTCHTPTVTVSGIGTYIYTVTAHGIALNTCQTTNTVAIIVSPNPTVSVNSPSICAGTPTTLTATGASTFTWSANAGSATTSTVSVSPSVTTTYTVNGTDANGCTGSATSTVSIVPAPTITVSAASLGNCFSALTNTICGGSSAVLTATSSVTNYTWNPGSITGASVTVTPTVTTTYTVTGSNGSGCNGTQTITVFVTNNCNCPGVALSPLPAASVVTVPTGTYVLNSNITVPTGGTYNLTNVTIGIGSNTVSPTVITVNSGGVLNINGSHLYACQDMWQGIVVKQGGTVNITGGSMIEDAIVAIDNNPTNALQIGGAPSTIQVNGAIFNCNLTSIRQRSYQAPPPANYLLPVFSVNDAVFTCRCGITPGSTAPLTIYQGGGAVANPTLNDFYSVSTFPVTSLKAPHTGELPFEGIHLEANGIITTPTNAPIINYVYNIGGSNLNLFDLHTYGINATTTSFSVTNSAFQNPIQRRATSSSPPTIGGYGINAVNPLTVPNGAPYTAIYVNTSQFIDMVRGIHDVNYFDIYIHDNTLFSRQVIVPLSGSLPIIPPHGGYGIFSAPTYYRYANISKNNIANINTCIDFTITGFLVGGLNTETVGLLRIDSNVIADQFPTTSFTNRYAGNGIIVDNSITPSASTYTNSGIGYGTKILVQKNTISKAYRGILIRNQQRQEIRDDSNTVTMQYEQTTLANQSTQYGIEHVNDVYQVPGSGFANDINYNVITGFTQPADYGNLAFFESKKGIWCVNNINHYVTCNSVDKTGRAIEFTGMNGNFNWVNNQMSNSGEGYVLSGGGIVGTQRASGAPCNIYWGSPSTFSPINPETYVDGTSNGNSSLLYVRNIAGFVPTNNLGGGVVYVNNIPAPSPNLVVATAPSNYNCNTNVPPSVLPPPPTALMASVVQNTLPYVSDTMQNSAINKNQVYRQLKNDTTLTDSSAVLQTFYAANQNTNRGKLAVAEDSLGTGNFVSVNSMLAGITPHNVIEQNHKRFYQIVSNFASGNGTSADSSDLEALAASCPLLNGIVVHQARAFHNSWYLAFKHYEDNCPRSIESRGAGAQKTTIESNNSIFVYPNPNNGKVYLGGFNLREKTTDIEIIDMAGKLVYKQQNVIDNGRVELNLQLMNGVYFVKITNTDGVSQMQKMIIQN
jgi:hypothetical protein